MTSVDLLKTGLIYCYYNFSLKDLTFLILTYYIHLLYKYISIEVIPIITIIISISINISLPICKEFG